MTNDFGIYKRMLENAVTELDVHNIAKGIRYTHVRERALDAGEFSLLMTEAREKLRALRVSHKTNSSF